MKTKLKDRELWYDGVLKVDPKQLADFLLKGIPANLLASEQTPDVKAFNQFSDDKILDKTEAKIDQSWNIPDHYKYLDVDKYLESLRLKILADHLYEIRLKRFDHEVELFRKNDLLPLIRVLKYVLDVFDQQSIIWGVGRGSSCSSYLLHLMGLHAVDCVLYNIDIADFIK